MVGIPGVTHFWGPSPPAGTFPANARMYQTKIAPSAAAEGRPFVQRTTPPNGAVLHPLSDKGCQKQRLSFLGRGADGRADAKSSPPAVKVRRMYRRHRGKSTRGLDFRRSAAARRSKWVGSVTSTRYLQCFYRIQLKFILRAVRGSAIACTRGARRARGARGTRRSGGARSAKCRPHTYRRRCSGPAWGPWSWGEADCK